MALVVAASTLVTDFQGYFALGWGFAIALLFAFLINLALGLSAAHLSVAFPRAGALYNYAESVFKGKFGVFLGLFLGLTFYGMFALAVSGETAAGAFGLQALLGTGGDVRWYILILTIAAVIPNIIGIKEAALVSALLLIFMLGIRLVFGVAGFMGFADTGSWSAANLVPEGGVPGLFDDAGILVVGLALAFWSFVGIEFACSLAEEVKEPKKAMPYGIAIGLVVILLVSWIMGIGVVGTMPLAEWAILSSSETACGGDCPQLATGQEMFGSGGYTMMALASATATLGTLTISYAAMPRLIYAMAREGRFFGAGISGVFAKLHPTRNTPVNATLLTAVIFILPALWSAEVINWLYSAAYVWIIIYIVFHLLGIAKERLQPETEGVFSSGQYIPIAIAGIVLTIVGLYYAFLGVHGEFGGRALYIIVGAGILAGLSYMLQERK